MRTPAFENAMAFLLEQEGGEVDDPKDKGKHTKYGISSRAYPKENITDLTIERAKELYLIDYWIPLQCDLMPYQLALGTFDMGVNAGIKTGAVCLQRALRVFPDGVIGKNTLLAAMTASPMRRIARNLAIERILCYSQMDDWPVWCKGWTKRTFDALLASL
jgi:lysozyme family protein